MEKDLILEYINSIPENEPIYINEIKKYVYMKLEVTNSNSKEKLGKKINLIVNRLKNAGVINNADKGIYYKPIITIFGPSILSKTKLRDYKYIQDLNGNLKGYLTGAQLFNYLGLTSQVPNNVDIVTNECKYNKFYDKKYNANIKKPKITITNENCLYLQLLDILENKDNVNIEVDEKNANKIIYEFIDEYNLKYEYLIYLANATKNKKALNKLIILARKVVN